MNLFDVYSLFNITPARARGCYLWDTGGRKYLDLYGGHAVISIGHSHPRYISSISEQLEKMAFYSNAVVNPLQQDLAGKLGNLSGYPDYRLFLCNSGAEANENAIKLASFITGRRKMIAFRKGFHGRTSAAVALTDNPGIIAPFNETENAVILPLNDLDAVETHLKTGEVAGVIIEGIQGVGGIHLPEASFLLELKELTQKYGSFLILDEIQSGYGRSGKFFAHQHAGVKPDMITVAKGMGNGFPMGGVLIHPAIEARKGMLGTTFGGNHLACAAGIAVLTVMEEEHLVENARETGAFLLEKLKKMDAGILVRGQGLMIGIELPFPVRELREKLLFEHAIFTGVSGKNILRLLPPLTLTTAQAEAFLRHFTQVFAEVSEHK